MGRAARIFAAALSLAGFVFFVPAPEFVEEADAQLMKDPRGLPAWPCSSAGVYRITGYVKGGPGLSSRTFDGTSVWSGEKIVAASWNIPIDTLLRVKGLDYTYRVADRGNLGGAHIDVLVDSVAIAHEITGMAEVCIVGYGPKR